MSFPPKKAYSFGRQQVTEDEKNQKVQGVFSSVATKYDLMNDVMSWGLHRCWKNDFVDYLPIRSHHHVLDVAGGTGDISLRLLEKGSKEVVVLDRNPSMLLLGRQKAIDQGIVVSLKWACGDAQALPFSDQTFDFYTISFGIRNVTRRELALQEAWRVLKKGGIFACLEFSHSSSPFFRPFIEGYQKNLIPLMGNLIAGDRESYQYLVESIENFPEPDVFSQELESAGFVVASVHTFMKGVAAIHLAVKK